jgi:16S rRNA (guanine1207-N2)-methyltransferase
VIAQADPAPGRRTRTTGFAGDAQAATGSAASSSHAPRREHLHGEEMNPCLLSRHRQTMTEHYFTRQPTVPSKPVEIETILRGRTFRFRTDRGVFSHGRLDPGTRLLIETMEVEPTDTVLDYGCGYGAVGVAAATLVPGGFVWMVDSNARAVALARINLRLNGLHNARARRGEDLEAVPGVAFDVIATNPPVHAGRQVIEGMTEQARRRLRPGGRFYWVGRTDKGVKTMARRLAERFGRVEEVDKRAGYRVYVATKNGGPGME